VPEPRGCDDPPVQRVRHLRLALAFARYCLIREATFRTNFLVRAAAGVGWLLLLVFYFDLIFGNTKSIGDWSREEFFFLMGTYFLVGSIVETLFLNNCARFSEIVRTGQLDFALTKPVDEQFLLSLERIDWAELPNAFVGIGLVAYSTYVRGVAVTPAAALGYLALVAAGVALLYSLMLALASSSVWLVRSQWFLELWFTVMLFARYPAEIYRGGVLGNSIRFAFSWVVPVLLAVNVPARFGAKAAAPASAAYLVAAAVVLLAASRWFFFFALSRYRSASS